MVVWQNHQIWITTSKDAETSGSGETFPVCAVQKCICGGKCLVQKVLPVCLLAVVLPYISMRY